jgi:cell division protein FtsA
VPFGGNVVTQDIKEGCSILNRQAEALKTQFGSALGDLAPEDKVVTIPGISGREPKEISFKSLAYIIQSRMEEIIDAVMFEIENSGCIEKLSAGIVLTGGGAMLKHLAQLVKFRTGMDVRIGFPNEFLASSSLDDINHPMYSTSIGLLIKGLELEKSTPKTESVKEEPVQEDEFEEDIVDEKQNSGNFMDAIKRGFTNIFEEKGASMED